MRVPFTLAVLLSSCAAGVPLGPRASFDLNCPKESLSYTDLGEDAWGVTGCGQRATYQWSCGVKSIISTGNGKFISKKKCQWVRD